MSELDAIKGFLSGCHYPLNSEKQLQAGIEAHPSERDHDDLSDIQVRKCLSSVLPDQATYFGAEGEDQFTVFEPSFGDVIGVNGHNHAHLVERANGQVNRRNADNCLGANSPHLVIPKHIAKAGERVGDQHAGVSADFRVFCDLVCGLFGGEFDNPTRVPNESDNRRRMVCALCLEFTQLGLLDLDLASGELKRDGAGGEGHRASYGPAYNTARKADPRVAEPLQPKRKADSRQSACRAGSRPNTCVHHISHMTTVPVGLYVVERLAA